MDFRSSQRSRDARGLSFYIYVKKREYSLKLYCIQFPMTFSIFAANEMTICCVKMIHATRRSGNVSHDLSAICEENYGKFETKRSRRATTMTMMTTAEYRDARNALDK